VVAGVVAVEEVAVVVQAVGGKVGAVADREGKDPAEAFEVLPITLPNSSPLSRRPDYRKLSPMSD
jgi:hypothetical protein